MNIKRLFVVVVSQVVGFLVTYLTITVGFNMLPAISSIETPQARTIGEYGIQYFLVTAVPIGITIMIWMDKYMDTRILPD
jgi:hypothetical protein